MKAKSIVAKLRYAFAKIRQHIYRLFWWQDQSEDLGDLICNDELDDVKTMINSGADVNLAPLFGEKCRALTPLGSALFSHANHIPVNTEMIKLLIKKGADVNNGFVGINRLPLESVTANTSQLSIQFSMDNQNVLMSTLFDSYYEARNFPFFRICSSRKLSFETITACSASIPKLLISNGASIQGCIKGETFSDQNIVDLFLPRAITLKDTDSLSLLSINEIMDKLPHDIKLNIAKYTPMFIHIIQQTCNIDMDRATKIYNQIVTKIATLNSEQLATQRAYLLFGGNLLAKLRDILFASTIAPIRQTGALEPTLIGSTIKFDFTAVFMDIISSKTAPYFHRQGREKISQMAQEIASHSVGQNNLNAGDLKIIFKTLLYVAANEHQHARKTLEPYINQQNNKYYIGLLWGMIPEQTMFRRLLCNF